MHALFNDLIHLRFVPCHRRKDRSFCIQGHYFPICARCTSILMGYLVIPLLFLIDLHSFWLGAAFNIPMLIDGFTQAFKWRESNNWLRFMTGLLSGIGQSMIIVFVCIKIVSFLS